MRDAGWGVAYWPAGARGIGECEEWAFGFTGAPSTNNVAEYDGIYEALKRAWERAPEPCVFEVDSLLVAEQLNGNYACRSTDLQGTYSKCVDILKSLTARGQPWEIRHIYREYNATADALAGQGASYSGRRQSGAW